MQQAAALKALPSPLSRQGMHAGTPTFGAWPPLKQAKKRLHPDACIDGRLRVHAAKGEAVCLRCRVERAASAAQHQPCAPPAPAQPSAFPLAPEHSGQASLGGQKSAASCTHPCAAWGRQVMEQPRRVLVWVCSWNKSVSSIAVRGAQRRAALACWPALLPHMQVPLMRAVASQITHIKERCPLTHEQDSYRVVWDLEVEAPVQELAACRGHQAASLSIAAWVVPHCCPRCMWKHCKR